MIKEFVFCYSIPEPLRPPLTMAVFYVPKEDEFVILRDSMIENTSYDKMPFSLALTGLPA